MFGVVGFLAVPSVVYVFFKSVSKPSGGLSCVFMVAYVTFRLMYAAALELLLFVAVDCKVLHCHVVSMYAVLRPRFLNTVVTVLILIWFLKQVNFARLCSCLFSLLLSFHVVIP